MTAKMIGWVCVFSLLFLVGYSQTGNEGKLILFNGKIISFQKARIAGNKILYQLPNHTKKDTSVHKKRKIDDVFSIEYASGEEKMMYIPDTAFGGELAVNEMRMFIKGQQDAWMYYHKPMPAIGGFAAGFAGSYFGFYSVLAPALYLTAVGAKTPKIDKLKSVHADIEKNWQNADYVAGFQKKAKDKNIINGAKGALLGLIAGLITFHFVLAK